MLVARLTVSAFKIDMLHDGRRMFVMVFVWAFLFLQSFSFLPMKKNSVDERGPA
jgi:hypothetical protein